MNTIYLQMKDGEPRKIEADFEIANPVPAGAKKITEKQYDRIVAKKDKEAEAAIQQAMLGGNK